MDHSPHNIFSAMSMFHVKHVLSKIKSQSVADLVFYVLIFSIPLQIRTILNIDDSYIDYYFSYHKAFFVYITDILVLTLFLVTLWTKKYFKTPWFAFVPLILAGISLFHVEHFNHWLYSALKIAEFTFVFLFIYSSPHTRIPGMWILITSGIIQALLGIGQFHVEQFRTFQSVGYYLPTIETSGAATLDIAGEKILRAYGTFPHPNLLGGFMAVSIGFLLIVSRETVLRRSILAILGLILSWGLLVSFSRSAWLAAAIIIGIFITYDLAKKRFKSAISTCLLAAFLGVFFIAIYRDIVIPRAAETVDNNQAIEYRNDFSSQALTIWQQHFTLGIGNGQYIKTMETTFHVEPWQYQPPHNIFLYICVVFGTVGILAILGSLIAHGFAWNLQNTILIALILVLGSFDHYLLTIQQGQLIMIFLVGLILMEKRVS